MRVTVLLFARARELAGAGRLEVELADGATAAEAFEALVERTPRLAEMRAFIRPAFDNQYGDWGTALQPGAELALIPPTSGG